MLEDLPDELLVSILSHTPAPDVAAARAASRRLARVGADRAVWAAALARDHALPLRALPPGLAAAGPMAAYVAVTRWRPDRWRGLRGASWRSPDLAHLRAVWTLDVAGDAVLTGARDSRLRRFSWPRECSAGGEMALDFVLEGHAKKINAALWLDAAGVAVSGSTDASVRIWDLAAAEAGAQDPCSAAIPLAASVLTLSSWLPHAASPAPTRYPGVFPHAVAGLHDGSIALLDIEVGALVSDAGSAGGSNGAVQSTDVAVVGSAPVVAVGSYRGQVTWYDARAEAAAHSVKVWQPEVTKVIFDRKPTKVHVASRAGVAATYDIRALGRPLHVMDEHGDVIRDMVYVPSAGRLITGSYDGLVIVWDAETGDVVRLCDGHDDWVWTLAAGEEVFVSGDHSGIVNVWDLETGAWCATLPQGHLPAGPVALAMSDSVLAVTAGCQLAVHDVVGGLWPELNDPALAASVPSSAAGASIRPRAANPDESWCEWLTRLVW
ncbi:uncharacterized protein AMSG_07760 [Thecamonas trahens ATCC 50062]|uniref:F-box domain-containing protein n=1 Tax=Thecamonas trahens ATCC 50062 TaxID=461836 RepID=A0A0L0DHW7_THETB|nr:hypothetical protein AMSG_07760 [Thecamonas trahens ATCC 50062]KNC51696.1 hypothetical protein AMSG_07760 [Thecamonas trahens ATCC 50062]|eukprot:XP_013755825.1 hypothetical protein AMSG_07760 [Thecamonas trahens ATCC 50062]